MYLIKRETFDRMESDVWDSAWVEIGNIAAKHLSYISPSDMAFKKAWSRIGYQIKPLITSRVWCAGWNQIGEKISSKISDVALWKH